MWRGLKQIERFLEYDFNQWWTNPKQCVLKNTFWPYAIIIKLLVVLIYSKFHNKIVFFKKFILKLLVENIIQSCNFTSFFMHIKHVDRNTIPNDNVHKKNISKIMILFPESLQG
jgi:hypothetical protein